MNKLVLKVIELIGLIAVLVFFVVSLVQFLVSLVGGNKTENNPFWDCFDCFVNNNCGH